jgi:hypothetical protein
MPYTARHLINNTPKEIRDRTAICSISLDTAGKHIDDPEFGRCYKLVYNTRCTDGVRKVTLKYIGGLKPGTDGNREQAAGTPTPESEVWVSCTCPFHLFTNEYSLTKKRSSDILYSNGQPAAFRNPQNLGYVCKHTLLALEKSFEEAYKAKSTEQKPAVTDKPNLYTPSEAPELDEIEAPELDELTSIATQERKKREEETKKLLSLQDASGIKFIDTTFKDEPIIPPTEESKRTWRKQLTDFINKLLPKTDTTWRSKLEKFVNTKVKPEQDVSTISKEIDQFLTKENTEKAPTSWRDKLKKWLS